jgi:hypothetical protein
VLRKYPISNHHPLKLRLRKSLEETSTMVKTLTVRIDVDMCRKAGEKLVTHNKWNTLTNEEGEPEEESL